LTHRPGWGSLPGEEAKCITDNWVLILQTPDPLLLDISIAFDKILTFVPLTETDKELFSGMRIKTKSSRECQVTCSAET